MKLSMEFPVELPEEILAEYPPSGKSREIPVETFRGISSKTPRIIRSGSPRENPGEISTDFLRNFLEYF